MGKYEQAFLPHLGYIPFDPAANRYVAYGQFTPHTYTNWRDETLSWKVACHISVHLSSFPFVVHKGPDVLKLYSDITVNRYDNFPIGNIKHIIFCNDKGNVIMHGLALRTGEDEIKQFAFSTYFDYHITSGKYKVETFQDEFGGGFVFQIGGPRSLEVIEQAAQEDLHDLGFMRFCGAKIAGHDIRIARIGMSGTLAYEVQGPDYDTGIEVYNELMRVGKPYGIVKLGLNQYECQHSENGFPQCSLHFPNAQSEQPDFIEFLNKDLSAERLKMHVADLELHPRGTLSDDIKDYFRNPFELGWGHMVNFGHEFIGKKALLEISKHHRKMVTLIWNPEDMMKVFASYFEEGPEPYPDMAFPHEFSDLGTFKTNYFHYKVLKDGKLIGAAMWRTYSIYYRKTLSICCIDPEFAEIGTNVTILFGDAGKRSLEIRAKVERYPYLDLPSNKDYDLNTIPRFKK
jgi:glycine cleavage system aminomethyltransferase T